MELAISKIATKGKYNDYHFMSLFLSVGLICLTPFTTPYLSWVAFGIQIIRLLGCSVETFLIDLACLLPFSNIFREPGGKTLYSVLILVACAYFVLSGKFKPNVSLAWCIVLFGYMLTRSVTNFITSLIILSGILIIGLTCTFITRENASIIAKVNIFSVLFASVYGYIFKDNNALINYTRDPALTQYGSDAVRFKGLFQDPNYYASIIIIALALTIVLYIIKELDLISFIVGFAGFTIFGFMTYSKTFLIIYIVACFFYMAVSVKRKRFLLLFILVLLFLIIIFNFVSGKIEFFDVMRDRFGESGDLNGFTTGRADTWEGYLQYIFSDAKVMIFGATLGAPLVNGVGTHNLVIEILYYAGIIGLILFVCFFWSVITDAIKNNSNSVKREGVMKYVIIIMFVMFYFSLQALFFSTMYMQWILVVVGVLLSCSNINFKQKSSINE